MKYEVEIPSNFVMFTAETNALQAIILQPPSGIKLCTQPHYNKTVLERERQTKDYVALQSWTNLF